MDPKTLNFKDRLVLFLASGLFLGLIPFAPGTFGSLLGIPLHWLFSHLPFFPGICSLGFVILISVWISGRAELLLGKKDPSQIVIDEVVGMAVALAGAPLEPSLIIVAFMFFRFFDIWKPFPIRYIDKSFPGGWGIVLDDVAAGVMANLAWRLWDFYIGTQKVISHAW
ncbi:MAG: phosphatidylglycerophosphatase A [Thermodesulfobacteriota bacterium]|nr:MAG: phosphatidylglycerophosphatase A [Thermodesulfobacteriota bacterium]